MVSLLLQKKTNLDTLGEDKMVLNGQFYCDDCGMVEVSTPYEYCNLCVEEIVAYLEEADIHYHERMKQKYFLELAIKQETLDYIPNYV